MRVDALFRKTENRIKPLSIALGLGIALLGSRMADPAVTVAVRIIVVDGADEAARILLQLMGGADFAELARVKSTDATSVDGGFLGGSGPRDAVHHYQSLETEPQQVRQLQLFAGLGRQGTAAEELALGTAVPDFTLADQTGHNVRLSQLAGTGVVSSFFYTRCPLPNYCFRLSNNLGRLQKRFADRMGRDLELLSVTMDPVPTRRRR